MAKAVKQEEKETVVKHVVIKPFNDVNDFSIAYNEGDDVSHFAPERLEYAIGVGLVEKVVNDK